MTRSATLVIFNPAAGGADGWSDLSGSLEALGEIEVRRTAGPGDARRFASASPDDGFDTVIAAGGDGTIHEVVSGLASHLDRITLGVLPLGTGNDLARTIGMPDDPDEAVRALARRRTTRLDLLCVACGEETRYAVNSVTAGFSALVDERLESVGKDLFGRLVYLVTTGLSLPDLQSHRTVLEADGRARRLDLFNLVLSNGGTVGGGVPVAPDARLDDGRAQLLLVSAMPLPTLAAEITRLVTGAELDRFEVSAVRKVEIDSDPAMSVTADGEVIGSTPVSVGVMPQALACIVGDASDDR